MFRYWVLIIVMSTTPLRCEGQADHAMPIADHHMHLRSDAMAVAITRAQERMNEGRPGNLAALGASEVLAALNSARVRRAVALSSAYLFGMPDMRFEHEEQSVVAENNFVSAEVSKEPQRLVGFCSVNPLAGYAVTEVRRCTKLPGIAGIKLHFANSNVDLRDALHIARLKAVFREAQVMRCPVIVHMHTRRPDYGAVDAERFIRDVLAEAPGIRVQIAHMAGGGGSYHDGADDAMGAFVEAFRRDPSLQARIWFDLGGVVYPPEGGVNSARARTTQRQHERLVQRIREVGPDHVLFASDWDALSVTVAADHLVRWLPVKPTELQTILQNRAGYLR
jgi:uncharacterized protein